VKPGFHVVTGWVEVSVRFHGEQPRRELEPAEDLEFRPFAVDLEDVALRDRFGGEPVAVGVTENPFARRRNGADRRVFERDNVLDAIDLDRPSNRFEHLRTRLEGRHVPFEVCHPGGDDGRRPPPATDDDDAVASADVTSQSRHHGVLVRWIVVLILVKSGAGNGDTIQHTCPGNWLFRRVQHGRTQSISSIKPSSTVSGIGIA
jgi:hypothetical protein